MTALVFTVFAASLVGSLHCAGMCGGFVAFGAGSGASQLAYHFGRLVTYVILGALAGSVGAAIDLAGAWAGLPRVAAIIAGASMFFWGGLTLAKSFGFTLRTPAAPSPLRKLLFRVHGVVAKKPPVTRGLLLGLVTTLLPCGWLYAFAVTAAGTGQPVGGAAVMAFFWLGTVPVLAALGAGVKRLAGSLRVYLPRVAAVAVMVVGLLAIAGRIDLVPAHAAGEGQVEASCHGHD